MGFHMHPPQGIPSALPTQEALSLHPRAALSRLLLGADSLDPRPEQRSTMATCLRCLGRGNSRMANIGVIWFNMCPSPVTPVGRATHPMVVGRITGS